MNAEVVETVNWPKINKISLNPKRLNNIQETTAIKEFGKWPIHRKHKNLNENQYEFFLNY